MLGVRLRGHGAEKLSGVRKNSRDSSIDMFVIPTSFIDDEGSRWDRYM